jgi:hypothetical protein
MAGCEKLTGSAWGQDWLVCILRAKGSWARESVNPLGWARGSPCRVSQGPDIKALNTENKRCV